MVRQPEWEGKPPARKRPAAVVRPVVGWSEYVALPEWGIPAIRAKTDTGARSSALHVDRIEELSRGRVVRFEVVLHRQRRHRSVSVVAPVSRRARVRSSNGHYSLRVFVTTTIRIGPVERKIEISLVDREQMIYRMLLGRTALEGLLVDAGHKDLLGEQPRRRAHGTSKNRRATDPRERGPRRGDKIG